MSYNNINFYCEKKKRKTVDEDSYTNNIKSFDIEINGSEANSFPIKGVKIVKSDSYNILEVDLLYKLKNLYKKDNNILGLSDRQFSAIIGIDISDIKSKQLRFSVPGFRKLVKFLELLINSRDLAKLSILELAKLRLSYDILPSKKSNNFYFGTSLLELHREKDLCIVMKEFNKIIGFDFYSAIVNMNRITDRKISSIERKLSPFYDEDQKSALTKIIQIYKKNRPKLILKLFDDIYKTELDGRIQSILEYLSEFIDLNISQLKNKALSYFDIIISKLTYQQAIPTAHTGYFAPALVYFVLRANNIYYIDDKHISTINIINTRNLKFLGLTKRTMQDIPIKKLFPYLTDEIRKKIGALERSNYTESDFINEFKQAREEFGYTDDEYPTGKELSRLSPKYKSFVRASYRYGGGFDEIVSQSGFSPFKKEILKYAEFELYDFAQIIGNIANELGYESRLCPSSKDLAKNYQPLCHAFRKAGYILKDLIPFGLYPSDWTLARAVGGLVHYIFEYEIIKYLLSVFVNAYYEIYPNIYNMVYKRVDNAILNNEVFRNNIFYNQKVLNLTEKQLLKIILFLFDYTISTELDFLTSKCLREYHNSQRFLIIVSLFGKHYDLPNNIPLKDHVIQLDFDEFSQFLCLPSDLVKYLSNILSLAKHAIYRDCDNEMNASFEELSIISRTARQDTLKEYRTTCNQSALESDLFNLFRSNSKVRTFLTNQSL